MRTALSSLFSALLMLQAQNALAMSVETTAAEAIRMYDARPDERPNIELVLFLSENAYGWVNADLKNRGERMLYCTKGEATQEGAVLVGLVRKQLQLQPGFNGAPVTYVLLRAMQTHFPCGTS